MEIGKKLKEARLNRDLTQEVIAEKLNVSRQTISNWENEKSYPDIISGRCNDGTFTRKHKRC